MPFELSLTLSVLDCKMLLWYHTRPRRMTCVEVPEGPQQGAKKAPQQAPNPPARPPPQTTPVAILAQAILAQAHALCCPRVWN